MFEQSKSAKRRFNDGYFHSRYFVGNGIDIGCGDDSIGKYRHVFKQIVSVKPWDVEDGDAQLMLSVNDNTYDFIHSSHSLEHMNDPYQALSNWIRITKPGGFLIITIPDEIMYEKDMWPSRFNDDHKYSFTLRKTSSMPNSINVLDMCYQFSHITSVEKLQYIDEFFDYNLPIAFDQTLSVTTECCIEIILKKN